ncbi:MAG: glycogen/starch/alpha-glucan phosphorylase, partial [Oscillospiraceae bacterium]|nr:glycogen/starch/alpha-glucan phosphorylase [Oscillospiraceae bacterium]
ECEHDAGLGNGGLGRLASCYMDAATTLDYPVTGFSILYEFGIFRQRIIDGWQVEFPDNWLSDGEVWLRKREEDAVEVRFGGEVHEWFDNGIFKVVNSGYDSVLAVPYDLYITGYDTNTVNRLVLWSASKPQSFDMAAFAKGDYESAMYESNKAQIISKVLYPSDDHVAGKKLRLQQQYFFVSASLQSILTEHLRQYKTLDNLPDKVAIHINDTHPALCVPELMRLLMDECGLGWDEAWDLTCRTLSYTNHTVMAEALEHWPCDLFESLLPRLYSIVKEINRRLMEKITVFYPNDPGKWEYMQVISGGEVRMANLCLACCHMTNGVSRLHTDILMKDVFHDYYAMDNSKFTSVTNGIAYRRWLGQANPLLTDYLKELIGDGFMKDANELEKLMKYADDKTVLDRLEEIKLSNKTRLARYIANHNGLIVDPSSMFDVQVKRLHEYKRQLLNALNILKMYNEIKDDPNKDFVPRTFVFAAKASAGYTLAKEIIKLIVCISNFVNSDPEVRDKLKVVFLEDYKVSLAEVIIPAANISEQISNAGKEASGTSNMKLMLNGAVTLGTLDGANVEILEQVGEDNIFLFGMTTEEVDELRKKGYDPRKYLTPELDRALDMLTYGVLGERFDGIMHSLFNETGWADQYMTIADFTSYSEAQKKVSEVFTDRDRFNR